MFKKQCKGTDLFRVKTDDNDLYYCSIKFDGVYLQIHKTAGVVTAFTSSGKQFSNAQLTGDLLDVPGDFIIECEYITGSSRSDADADLKRMVKDSSYVPTGKLMVFDIINDLNFISRVGMLGAFPNAVRYRIMTLAAIRKQLLKVSSLGYEGLFIKKGSHSQVEGKKSLEALKVKVLKTADLTVDSIVGDYLHLSDSNGVTAKVRVNYAIPEFAPPGTLVEIGFDFIGKSYNQARFIAIRSTL